MRRTPAERLRLHGHAGLCVLCIRIWRAAWLMGNGPRFTVGLILLLGNVPFGYGALALCSALAAARDSYAWGIAGGICYVLSWVMLGAGILLVGPRVHRFLSHETRIKTRAWWRFRQQKHFPSPKNDKSTRR